MVVMREKSVAQRMNKFSSEKMKSDGQRGLVGGEEVVNQVWPPDFSQTSIRHLAGLVQWAFIYW